MLVSQVLSDFVGQIKANINTEIQMRTRDEGDLERIKTKYGGDMLQSLVKANVGAGMVQNANYNHGQPFFVQFRVLKHDIKRLTDEELDQYNKYNDQIDDLDSQLTQLTQEGIDIFDLKLELKLALDKVKTGNFNMVDIYLEGLKPRIQKNWEKLGKQPKKFERKMVEDAQLKADFEKAKKEHEKLEEREKKSIDESSLKKEVKGAPSEAAQAAPERGPSKGVSTNLLQEEVALKARPPEAQETNPAVQQVYMLLANIEELADKGEMEEAKKRYDRLMKVYQMMPKELKKQVYSRCMEARQRLTQVVVH
jgi:hypothetical protein